MKSFVGFVTLLAVASAYNLYSNYYIFQVQVENQRQLDLLVQYQYSSNNTFDILTREENTVSILVDGTETMDAGIYLQKHKLRYLSGHFGLSDAVKADWEMIQKTKKFRKGMKAVDFTINEYHSYEEINDFLDALADEYPNIAQVETIGKSYQGQDVKLLKITNGNGSGKKAIFIDGGIHAREWISVATVVYIINELVQNPSNNPEYETYLDNVQFYIVPILNPDGYEHSRNSDRMWRKTRNVNPGSNCLGTDANRNFDYNFGGPGASSNPCSATYHGPSAFSTPEADNMRKFLEPIKENLRGYVAVHSFSQLVLYCCGDSVNTVPPNVEDIKDQSDRMVDAIEEVHSKRFRAGATAQILYLASGIAADWASASLGIKYSYTYELRPRSIFEGGFSIPPSNIVPSGEETFAGFKVMISDIIKED